MGVDMRHPSDTVTLPRTAVRLCERATDASGERIHPSPGPRRSREKSQITGCGHFTGHHRNVGYAAKRAKICIHKKGGGAVN